jgi:drug/metabolite transporter (DMT)-like permease
VSRIRAEAALVVAALLYGVTFPLVKDALDDITPFAYLVGRFSIATLLVAPSFVRALRPPSPPTDRRFLLRVGAVTGVLLFGGYAAQTVGLQYTTASTSAFITGLYVLITPLIESLTGRRLPRPSVIAGVVVATVGLYLLTGASLELGRGELLTLLGAVLFAGHIVAVGTYARKVPPAAFTGLQLGVVAILCMPPTAVDGVGSITLLAVFAVVFTGVACSGIALPLQVWGQRRIPPTRAALILLAEPVFAGVASWLTGESLTVTRLAGGAVILGGIVISELGSREREDEQPTSCSREAGSRAAREVT